MSRPARPTKCMAAIRSSEDWGGRATRAEIDLDVIEANVRALLGCLTSGNLMTVVKANGYGHGAAPIAEAAIHAGACYLGVYAVSEGIELRQAAINLPILVFGSFQPSEARDIVAYDLLPTVTTVDGAEALASATGNRRIAFHLKVDTGLTRAGIPAASALEFMRRIAPLTQLVPEGIFTHFASADEADKDLTRLQLDVFDDVRETLAQNGFRFKLQHVANSAATLDLPETHRDLARCGIGTYGYYPSDSVCSDVMLHPAMSLVSTITRLTCVPAGTGIGYGHEFRSTRPTTIALVPIGYGDGLPRSLGNGHGRVLVRGHAAPIVGRVSMDQITLDVTRVPGVAVGTRAVLIGSDAGATQTADDLADRAGTISYDILTGLLPRVPRLYVRGEEIVG
ncbi:MAG: alanine racemase [Chloroflexota bacterium]